MWELFFVQPTERAYRTLRRYVPASQCSAHPLHNRLKYHSKWVLAGELEFDSLFYADETHSFYPEDPRWPTACECGYQFVARDARQHTLVRIFEGERHGFTVRGTVTPSPAYLPPGAMWCVEPGTEIAKSSKGKPGPDGKFWFVMLPGHTVWEVYAPGKDGRSFELEGRGLRLTSKCTITAGNYRGYLVDGVLSADVQGRKFHKNGHYAMV